MPSFDHAHVHRWPEPEPASTTRAPEAANDPAPSPAQAGAYVLLPRKATEAMLRPFYECPPAELPLAWDACIAVAEAQARRAASPAARAAVDGCTCEACVPQGNPFDGTAHNIRMILCATCGNKRCPHATDHRNPCTGSNAPGQRGSSWEHVKPWPTSESITMIEPPEPMTFREALSAVLPDALQGVLAEPPPEPGTPEFVFAAAMDAARAQLAVEIAGDQGVADSPLVKKAAAALEELRAALEVPEGCTPVDARVLRHANHSLAMEVHELREQVAALTPPTPGQSEIARVLATSPMAKALP